MQEGMKQLWIAFFMSNELRKLLGNPFLAGDLEISERNISILYIDVHQIRLPACAPK